MNRRDFLKKMGLGTLGLFLLPTLKKIEVVFPFTEPIVEQLRKTCCWTGGSGNWSDINHWVGGVLPTSDDDVFIDASTFEPGTVVMVDKVAYCNNLTIVPSWVNGSLHPKEIETPIPRAKEYWKRNINGKYI
jgi:hypothetical protein